MVACTRLMSRVVLLAAGAIPAFASLGAPITFDDLGPSTGGTRMPASYAGLRWDISDWHYMSLASNPANTYVALSSTSTFVGSILDGAHGGAPDYYFDGADFWSRRGADANGDFYFVLYHDGVTVYNGRIEDGGRQRFDGTIRAFVPDYTGPVDGFAIAFDNDDWDHLAMDNIRIRPIAPAVCDADYNGDTTPDVLDFLDFFDDFSVCSGGSSPCGSFGDADVNGDTIVDVLDFLEFLDAFGAGCP
jgi:hypothetical protein